MVKINVGATAGRAEGKGTTRETIILTLALVHGSSGLRWVVHLTSKTSALGDGRDDHRAETVLHLAKFYCSFFIPKTFHLPNP